MNQQMQQRTERRQAEQGAGDAVDPMQQRMLAHRDARVVVLLGLQDVDGPLRVAGDEAGIPPRLGEQLPGQGLIARA